MKVVAPYRPFAPEAISHQRLGPFDWPAALRMLAASVARSCRCATFALTDEATLLDVPAHRYPARCDRLMLWLLEVCLRYLESDDFDEDTAMLSPDMLVYQDLRPWFVADLGIVARLSPKFRASGRILLFGAQFWRRSGRDRLVALYRQALTIAEALDDATITWGADTVPFYRLLQPQHYGPCQREGLSVHFIGETALMQSISGVDQRAAEAGRSVLPRAPIMDFKYLRKRAMAAYFRATIGGAA